MAPRARSAKATDRPQSLGPSRRSGAAPASVAAPPRRGVAVAALVLAPLPALAAYLAQIKQPELLSFIATSVLVSVAAFVLTLRLVPVVASKTLRRGLSGLDINKRGTPGGEVPIPEAAGLAAGASFLVASLLFQWLQHAAGTLPQGATSPAHAALVCVLAALFLGFVDDVLDVPWRVKLAMPTLASLPLLMAYTGHTGVVVPHLLRPALGGQAFLDLGLVYKLYMLAVSVFCTNSINILAGVNGLEAGQTLVLALACAAHSLSTLTGLAAWPPLDAAAKLQAHALSLSLVLPLAAVSAGILCFNWYPSKVFVGDTFTLFAGMTLAVAGILGHYSETLLLLFTPQVFNFVYSLPQLAHIVPCPRHRLPTLDPATGLLHGSQDYNLVNLVLRLGGPRTEVGLAQVLLAIQAACAVATFALRHALAGIYKG